MLPNNATTDPHARSAITSEYDIVGSSTYATSRLGTTSAQSTLSYIDQPAAQLAQSVKVFLKKGTTDRINSVLSLAAMWR